MIRPTSQNPHRSAMFVVSVWLLAIWPMLLGQSNASRTVKDAQDSLLPNIGEACEQLQSATRISEVLNLIRDMKNMGIVPKLDLVERNIVPKGRLCRRTCFKSYKDKIEPCKEQANLIYDLEKVITEKNNVCSKDHIDIIESYYEKHLKARALAAESNVPHCKIAPITEKFFMLYARQVSYKCSYEMLGWLKWIELQAIVVQSDFNMVQTCTSDPYFLQLCQSALLKDPTTCKKKKGSKLKRVRQCKWGSILSDIDHIIKLVTLLELSESTCAPSDAMLDRPHGSNEVNQDDLTVVVPPKPTMMITNLRKTCLKFKPLYDQTVMPVVRMIRIGADYRYREFDKRCAENPVLQRWFGITALCETLLKRLPIQDANKANEVLVDAGNSENENSHASTEDRTLDEEPDNNGKHLDFRSTLQDELWLYKYTPTKLQQIKHKLIKQYYQWLNVGDDVNTHIAYYEKSQIVGKWFHAAAITTAISFLLGQLLKN